MDPVLSATYTAADLGIAQVAGGVTVLVEDGSASLILCGTGSNTTSSIDLGAVAEPGSGMFLAQSPPDPADAASVQASGSMTLQMDEGQSRLFIYGSSGGLTMSAIGADGSIGAASLVSTSVGTLTSVTSFTVIPDAAGDLAALTQYGQSGFHLFEIGSTGYLTLTDQIADTPKSYVADVTDSAAVLLGGVSYLLTISAGENGITSYEVTASGEVILTDSLGNHDGLWISGAAALQTTVVGGQTYAIIASVTSDSLSVVRVNDMGCLFLADHVTDDLDSRFRGASALDVFDVAGRSFVVAGGSDAGLTIFELLPGGVFSLVSSTAFEDGQGMGNIASIDAAVSGQQVQIFVTEESGARLQVFEADFSGLGLLITASDAGATGGALDDRIIGTSGGQTLSGAGGDDFLHDGTGADTLVGGAGADVFLLMADSATDTIADFENGTDRIDLSDWGMIYSADALVITPTATGATISYGANLLVVTNAGGGTLAAGSLGDDDFLF